MREIHCSEGSQLTLACYPRKRVSAGDKGSKLRGSGLNIMESGLKLTGSGLNIMESGLKLTGSGLKLTGSALKLTGSGLKLMEVE